MAGALAERVFAEKMQKVGFTDVEVHNRQAIGLADLARYPLFTEDLLELMHDLLSPEQQAEVATAVIVTARKPEAS